MSRLIGSDLFSADASQTVKVNASDEFRYDAGAAAEYTQKRMFI